MICFLACSKRIFCIDNITLICVCRKACVCTMSAQISSVVTDGQSDQPVLAHHIPLYLIFKEQFQLQECEHEMKHFCTVCRHIFLENCQCPLKKEGIFLCKRTCHHSPPPPLNFCFIHIFGPFTLAKLPRLNMDSAFTRLSWDGGEPRLPRLQGGAKHSSHSMVHHQASGT